MAGTTESQSFSVMRTSLSGEHEYVTQSPVPSSRGKRSLNTEFVSTPLSHAV